MAIFRYPLVSGWVQSSTDPIVDGELPEHLGDVGPGGGHQFDDLVVAERNCEVTHCASLEDHITPVSRSRGLTWANCLVRTICPV